MPMIMIIIIRIIITIIIIYIYICWICFGLCFATCQFLHANIYIYMYINSIINFVLLLSSRSFHSEREGIARTTPTRQNIKTPTKESIFELVVPNYWFAYVTLTYTPRVKRLNPENAWVFKFGISEIPGADFQVNHVKLQGCTIPSANFQTKSGCFQK